VSAFNGYGAGCRASLLASGGLDDGRGPRPVQVARVWSMSFWSMPSYCGHRSGPAGPASRTASEFGPRVRGPTCAWDQVALVFAAGPCSPDQWHALVQDPKTNKGRRGGLVQRRWTRSTRQWTRSHHAGLARCFTPDVVPGPATSRCASRAPGAGPAAWSVRRSLVRLVGPRSAGPSDQRGPRGPGPPDQRGPAGAASSGPAWSEVADPRKFGQRRAGPG
jgi:hypothetical protein